MDLQSLVGNLPLKRQLEAEGARGLSHAYILSGCPGSGRKTLARLLAAALVCTAQDEGARPCLTCTPCRKVLAGIHPDVISIGADGKDVTVAQVRALRADAYIRPNEAPRKVYLILNAQTMNPSAQNAMLKLLEEGPAYAAFLLITDNAAALLQTVRSRCELLALSPVSPREAEEYLRRRFPDKPPHLIRAAVEQCEGVLGRAVDALEGAEATTETIREGAATLMERFAAGDELALFSFTSTLEKWDREALSRLFSEGVVLLREAMIGVHGVPRTDPKWARAVRAVREKLSPKTILAAVQVLDTLRAACGFNAGAGHLSAWLCSELALLMK